ncbi:MAG: type II toxin-antitoxin system RelE/ParE family toxin [Henriciella sp.]|uniref:type II toxin-antitoxin system RelE/ParE family toxin n=1 Tax=Henriciella sp. TaxID=1968823 RepID=UPI003C79272A
MAIVRITQPAAQDVRAACDRYRQGDRNLLANFLKQFKRARNRIGLFPESTLPDYRNLRRVPILRTDYVIYYSFEGEEALVKAVLHGSRERETLDEILGRRA